MQSAEGRLGLELGLGLVTLGGLPLVPTITIGKCARVVHQQRIVVITQKTRWNNLLCSLGQTWLTFHLQASRHVLLSA